MIEKSIKTGEVVSPKVFKQPIKALQLSQGMDGLLELSASLLIIYDMHMKLKKPFIILYYQT